MTEPTYGDDQITYEVDVAREISDDFLEDTSGALIQAQVESLAAEARSEGADINIARRFGPGTVSLIVASPKHDTLMDFADTALRRYGIELPDVDERLGHTPEERDGQRSQAFPNTKVTISMSAATASHLSDSIASFMRGELISSARRNDLKSLANDLTRQAYRAYSGAGQ